MNRRDALALDDLRHLRFAGGDVAGELRAFVPELHLLIDDISDTSDTDLEKRALPPHAELVLAALRDARRPGGAMRALESHIGVFRAFAADSRNAKALEQILRYVFETFPDSSLTDLFEHIARLAPATRESAMTMTIADRLRQEGMQQGMRQGLAAAKAAGVLDILDARGLAVADEQREQILACKDIETLTRWHRKAVTVATTGDLFA